MERGRDTGTVGVISTEQHRMWTTCDFAYCRVISTIQPCYQVAENAGSRKYMNSECLIGIRCQAHECGPHTVKML